MKLAALLALSVLGVAQDGKGPHPAGDIPKTFELPQESYDYVKREVMIPMRDGVKLFTSIVIPKGARSAPILLTRTPYKATARTELLTVVE
jgi:predicted acyl esterase